MFATFGIQLEFTNCQNEIQLGKYRIFKKSWIVCSSENWQTVYQVWNENPFQNFFEILSFLFQWAKMFGVELQISQEMLLHPWHQQWDEGLLHPVMAVLDTVLDMDLGTVLEWVIICFNPLWDLQLFDHQGIVLGAGHAQFMIWLKQSLWEMQFCKFKIFRIRT